MLEKKAGKQTSQLQKFPSIIATASIVGPKEGKGPLADYFDQAVDDEFWGEKSWEKAESKFMREVLAKVVSKASMAMDALDFVIAGDLLNQCIAANFGIRESNIPFYGIYGACSTIGEAMQLGSDRGRICLQCGMSHIEPLLLGREAVQIPAGAGIPEASNSTVDSDRLGRHHFVGRRRRAVYYQVYHR